ncbi:hypothetical protein CGCFRS4_v015473 [Colletotrichum fructicola]|nr:hypothetical protein CGCFRS4_v015473 [Colletotrichum fructicola]
MATGSAHLRQGGSDVDLIYHRKLLQPDLELFVYEEDDLRLLEDAVYCGNILMSNAPNPVKALEPRQSANGEFFAATVSNQAGLIIDRGLRQFLVLIFDAAFYVNQHKALRRSQRHLSCCLHLDTRCRYGFTRMVPNRGQICALLTNKSYVKDAIRHIIEPKDRFRSPIEGI